jgi:O6-methylguanine-DNA--protein-cysteine methyltransferase
MFHRPKPTRFRYVPRFWDPEKEKRERDRAKAEDRSLEGMKSRISSSFQGGESRYFDTSGYRRSLTQSNRRVWIILLSIIGLLYFVFKTFLPKLAV